MVEIRVKCSTPRCPGFFEDSVAWPGTVSMRTVPLRVIPKCSSCGRDLTLEWDQRLEQVVW
jgi:hypothetical protein